MSERTERPGKGRRVRRACTDEFKAGAVARVIKEGKMVNAVAEDLDLSPSVLRS